MTVRDEPYRGGNRVFMWFGHYSQFIIIAYVALAAGNVIAGQPGFLAWLVSVAAAVFLASIITDFNYHEDRLCERCIAATPLDPAAAAARWKPALWLHHSRFRLIVLLVALGFFAADIVFGFGYQHGHQVGWDAAASVVALLILAGSFSSDWMHRRLYPWCPYCHWDDGGDEESVPDLPREPVGKVS